MAKKRTSKKKAKRSPRKKASARTPEPAREPTVLEDGSVEANIEFAELLEHLLPRQREFLLAFYEESTIAAAAKKVGVSRQAHHDVWLAKDENGDYRYPLYAQLFNDARSALVELAEAELFRRGVRGVPEPIVYKGEIVADSKVIKYDTTALIFWLKGNCPEKYKERFEHTGKDGGPMSMTIDAARRIADNFDRRHRQLSEGRKQ